jgi:hypothetical protein
MTTAPTTNDLTRQQLDELDALLQKMLALPLNGSESSVLSSTAATSRSNVSEIPLPEALPTRTNNSAPYTAPILRQNARETTPVETRRADQSASPASIPQLLAIHVPSAPATASATRKAPGSIQRPPSAPLEEQLDLPAELVSNPFQMGKTVNPPADGLQSLQTQSHSEPAVVEYVPPMLIPLVGFNRLLHPALGRLGLAGRILRSGFGKNLLALAGLGLLAITAAKIAQLLGWVATSTTLPWPT